LRTWPSTTLQNLSSIAFKVEEEGDVVKEIGEVDGKKAVWQMRLGGQRALV